MVHDGLLSSKSYTKCQHALCGVHLLRELTYFEELSAETKAWATPLKELLLEMKEAVEREREAGGNHLKSPMLAELSECYERLVVARLEGQQPPGVPEQVQKQARNLLFRLERRKEEVLLFMNEFGVPFENHQAKRDLKRDLRMIKLQQKTSGCFRSEPGARQFCRIRSYVWTMRKQGQGVLLALDRVCRGTPLSLRKPAG